MAQVADTLQDALDIAYRAVSREDLICVTGSFYLGRRSEETDREQDGVISLL